MTVPTESTAPGRPLENVTVEADSAIVVVEIRGDKVRLGVEAPKEVPVHRREVFDAIQRNKEEKPAEATQEDAAS